MSMKWVPQDGFYGVDAYNDWVIKVASEYGSMYKEYDVLVRMADGFDISDLFNIFSILQMSDAESQELPFLFDVNKLYTSPNTTGVKTFHFTARVDEAFFVALDTLPLNEPGKLRELFDDIVVAQALPADAMCRMDSVPVLRPISEQVGDCAVVVAVIDEGIAFGHERFRMADGRSRVEFVWLQDAACEYRTDGVQYGRELTKRGFSNAPASSAPGIDALLQEHLKDGSLDEEGFYRDAGLIDFGRAGHKAAARRVAHGTHVMDLACGYEPGENRADRPIICVQLPTATVADTSGIGLQKFMLDAVAYIINRARLLKRGGERLPLVINFSSGMRAGPHDGSSAIESALDEIINERWCSPEGGPTAVVLPAGNSRLARGHAQFSLQARAPHSLAWRVQPDDHTSSNLEFSLPAEAPDADLSKVELTIRPPGDNGDSCPLSSQLDRRAVQWQADGGRVVCKAYFEVRPLRTIPPAGGGPIHFKRRRFVIALLPTAYHDAPGPLAPAGEWTITLTYTGSGVVEGVHAWIHWDDRPIGYPRVGRQSYFDDENYRRFQYPSGRERELDVDPEDQDSVDRTSCYVRRATTLNAIANGGQVVTIGGHRRKDLRLAKYSSIGPALQAPGQEFRGGPDATAVTDESIVTSGVLAAGGRDGSSVAMNGTSVAAPQVARLVADRFYPSGYTGVTPRAREIVLSQARNDEISPPQNPAPPNDPAHIGSGRLRLHPHIDTPAQRHRQPEPDLPGG